MNKIFKLVYKSGPHGDQCTTYNVKFLNSNVTLEDFLKNIVDNTSEWGTVYLKVPNSETYNLPYATENEKYKEIKIEYKYGKIITDRSEFSYYLDLYIDQDYKNMFANGGWSCMDYFIKISK